MKITARKSKSEFLSEVKKVLDCAQWDYQASSTSTSKDTEKACRYLETQKFSIKVIEAAIKQRYTEILKDIREAATPVGDIPEFFAMEIANELAIDRIHKFSCHTWSDYRTTNKWRINETATFYIY